MITVELTRDEMLYAAQGGVQRRVDAALAGRKDYFHFGDPWERDVLGSMAELAFARSRDHYWFPVYDRPESVEADVGRRWQVRSSKKADAPLVVREKDRDDQAFVLVTCDIPRFTIVGWMWGGSAKQDRWRVEASGGKPACWMVPQADLRSLEPEAVAA